ncbi:MAG: COP23 domain-containing protein [Pleurocapsa sp. MO_226.B13]|nr:COP23 domain-containing protein [Pleurocapsa sp. MO_226.B13]
MKGRYLSSLLTTATLAFGMTLVVGVAAKAVDPVFSCQLNEDSLTTVVTTNDGLSQPVFHWNRAGVNNQQQLCDSVSQKLNNYLAEGNNLSSVTFKPHESMGLPAVCLTEKDQECSLLLFTLEPSSSPLILANHTLSSILDEDLQTSPIRYQERGVQRTAYKVDFWQLMGLGW